MCNFTLTAHGASGGYQKPCSQLDAPQKPNTREIRAVFAHHVCGSRELRGYLRFAFCTHSVQFVHFANRPFASTAHTSSSSCPPTGALVCQCFSPSAYCLP
jgi:hypothetical protein